MYSNMCSKVPCLVAQLVGAFSVNPRVRFLVRAHDWVVGPVPCWGVYGRQLVDVSHISVSLSPFLYFSKINTEILEKDVSFSTLVQG